MFESSHGERILKGDTHGDPHLKNLYRIYDNDTGKAIADYNTVYDETLDDTKDLEIFDPSATWKKKV